MARNLTFGKVPVSTIVLFKGPAVRSVKRVGGKPASSLHLLAARHRTGRKPKFQRAFSWPKLSDKCLKDSCQASVQGQLASSFYHQTPLTWQVQRSNTRAHVRSLQKVSSSFPRKKGAENLVWPRRRCAILGLLRAEVALRLVARLERVCESLRATKKTYSPKICFCVVTRGWFGWLVGWLAGWLVGWFVGWLVHSIFLDERGP